MKPTKEQFEAAMKKVKSKNIENLVLIKLDYDTKIILPYKEGITFMGTLEKAELLKTTYGSPIQVQPIDQEKITMTILSNASYEDYKMCTLLGLSPSDLEEYKKEQNEPVHNTN